MAYIKNNEIMSRIVHKHDTETNWNKAINFIPLIGEIIVYDTDENYNYERFKIGDGKTTVINLPFQKTNINDLKAVSYDIAQELTDEQKIQARANIGAGEPQVQSDLSQNDETAPDYIKGVIRKESLPDGYPYKEASEIREQIWLGTDRADVTITDGRFEWGDSGLTTYHDGECVIVFDGVEYYTGQDIVTLLEFGDPNFVNYPFYANFVFQGGGYTEYTITCGEGTHQFELYYVVATETIHTIAEEFLPESAIAQADWSVNDESASSFIKNKPNENDALLVAIETELIDPITTMSGEILTDQNNNIITL